MLTFEQIEKLIELVARNELQGFELERSGFKLRIEGKGQVPPAPAVAAGPPAQVGAAPPAPPAAAPAETPSRDAVPAPEEAGKDDNLHQLLSPIVGTFYRRAAPDQEPYVEVGDRVKKGQVLCIVEAMKLMNEIESDVDGEIAEILPKDGQAIEFGEPLFAIRPS